MSFVQELLKEKNQKIAEIEIEYFAKIIEKTQELIGKKVRIFRKQQPKGNIDKVITIKEITLAVGPGYLLTIKDDNDAYFSISEDTEITVLE